MNQGVKNRLTDFFYPFLRFFFFGGGGGSAKPTKKVGRGALCQTEAQLHADVIRVYTVISTKI